MGMMVAPPVTRSGREALSAYCNDLKAVRTAAKFGSSCLSMMELFQLATTTNGAGRAIGSYLSTVKDVLSIPSTLGLVIGSEPGAAGAKPWYKTAANLSAAVASSIETVGFLGKAGVIRLGEAAAKIGTLPFFGSAIVHLPYFSIMHAFGTASAFCSLVGNGATLRKTSQEARIANEKHVRWNNKTVEIFRQTVNNREQVISGLLPDDPKRGKLLEKHERDQALIAQGGGALEASFANRRLSKIERYKNAKIVNDRKWTKGLFDLISNAAKIVAVAITAFAGLAIAHFSIPLFYVAASSVVLGFVSNGAKFAGSVYGARYPV